MNLDQPIENDQEYWGFNPVSDFAHCLLPALDALGWRGTQGQLFEVLPHLPNELGFADFLNVMASLKYESQSSEIRLNQIDARMLPCLFVPKNEPAKVLLKRNNQGYLVYDGATVGFNQIPKSSMSGIAVFFQGLNQDKVSVLTKQKDWFQIILSRFRTVFFIVFVISFVLSVIAFVAPIFVMTIYDQVFSGRSTTGLYLFIAGAGVFFFAEAVFRYLRSRLLGFIGVRLSHIVGTELIRRILYLPSLFTESAGLGAQISRIRDFETVRDFFSGKALVAIMELPLIALLLMGLAFLAGPVAYVPLVAIALFVVLGFIFYPLTVMVSSKSGDFVSKKKQFLMEMLSNFRAIKYTGSRKYWLNRYKTLSAEASIAAFQAGNIIAVINAMSQALVTVTGLATLTAGVLHVLDGGMSSGALMASMLIVWRILNPLKSGFGVLTQLGKIHKSVEQINRLMNMRMEKNLEAETTIARRFKGNISFSQVSLRYSAEAHPALLGVSFDVKHGETLLVIGHDGAGKSSILKLILGMYHPQVGKILIDLQNVHQIDPHLLRRSIGYLSQSDTFFFGTIAQNIRLASPSAAQKQLEMAAQKAGLLEEILRLPEGFETRINHHTIAQLSASFQRRLSLARVFVKESNISLFDEPERGLTQEQESHFLTTLKQMKGDVTAIIASPRTRYFQMADSILWLDGGRVKMYGPKATVIPLYLKAMAHP